MLYDNEDRFWSEVATWLKGHGGYAYTRKAGRRTLGLGIDRSDSLLFAGVTGHARALIPLFADPDANPDGRRLILLTRSLNVRYLAGLPTVNAIVSMSLSPQTIADLWENRWPDGERVTRPIADWVEALVEAQGMGFEVRVRLDPILPVAGWGDLYREFLAGAAAAGLRPARVTLGTYRQKNAQLLAWAARWGLPSLEWHPTQMIEDGTHEHLPVEERVAIHREVATACAAAWPGAEIALCKETRRCGRRLEGGRGRCDCLA